ncbi:MAG: hypothetical protein RUDDFDWM_000625 [Candidatus Fervidibacterota bacterium]
MRKMAWVMVALVAVALATSKAPAQEERAYPFEGKFTLTADVGRWFTEGEDVWGYSVTLGYFVSPNIDIAVAFSDPEGSGAMWSAKLRYWFVSGAERPNPTFYIGGEVGRTTGFDPENVTVWGAHVGVDWLITGRVSLYGEVAWRHFGGDVDEDAWIVSVGLRTSF